MPEEVKPKRRSYHIPIQIGHSARLRFRIAPVNKAIMNGDADWLNEEELCADNISSRELLFPFIDQYFPGKFLFKNELNLMPFSNAHQMAASLENTAYLLQTDYKNPKLDPLRSHFALDLLISSEEYEASYVLASTVEKEAAVSANIGVVIDYYRRIARFLNDEIKKYEPLDYHSFAISSPA